MVTEHLLVTRNYWNTALECSLDDIVRSFSIVDNLDDEVDILIIEDIVGIIRKLGNYITLLLDVAHTYALDMYTI